MQKNNELHDFMKTATREMNEEYIRIQKRATEDPGTAGDQGEENWATLFRDWLPSKYKVVTKGRILGYTGEAGPQIDILILRPEYPNKLLDKKLYLAGGVIAAFECKVTLKSSHIEETVKNSILTKRLYRGRTGTPYKELHSPIIYGLLAHSHSWKGEKSKPLENTEVKLIEYDSKYVKHPSEMLDLLCIADLAFWNSNRDTYHGPEYEGWNDRFKHILGKNGSVSTSYDQHSSDTVGQNNEFTPIGALIANIFEKMAWIDSSLRDLSEYYRYVDLHGSSLGQIRVWNNIDEVYTDSVLSKIKNGGIVEGLRWSEWGWTFS